jgi:glycosyltransferase involved in cell wall biosynthesis
MADKPLVSVVVPVFNYSKYLVDCIGGILMQEIDFPIEVIFGDDCSTDNSREIIREETSKNTDPLKSFVFCFHETNLGPKHFPGKYNWLHCLRTAKGEHIALCDGDDYWTDSKKLQKQIDLLRAHPEYAGVFHPADWFVEATGELIKRLYKPKAAPDYFTLGDILIEKGNPIPTCSVLFKNRIDELPQWYQEVDFGDYALDLINMKRGPYGYINEPMAVYREHPHGWHSKTEKIDNLEKQIHFYEVAADNLDLYDMWEYRQALFNLYIELHEESLKVLKDRSGEYLRKARQYASWKRNKWALFRHGFPRAFEAWRQMDYYWKRGRKLIIKNEG